MGGASETCSGGDAETVSVSEYKGFAAEIFSVSECKGSDLAWTDSYDWTSEEEIQGFSCEVSIGVVEQKGLGTVGTL